MRVEGTGVAGVPGLLPRCWCGSARAALSQQHGLEMAQCTECGVWRQVVRGYTAETLATWYADRYFAGVYAHAAAVDDAAAAARVAAYGFPAGTRVLDVGCGTGAFVRAARAAGWAAVGQDVTAAHAGPDIYVGALEEVAFPTGAFDVATLHDVLEHVLDPVQFLAEVCRVVTPGGLVVVDFPRFHHPAGVHHWKPVEHLWMLTEEHLHALLARAGLVVRRVTHPRPSKVVLYAEWDGGPRRPTVLVPPGIGDSYWALVKLPGFLAAHGAAGAAVWVHDAAVARRPAGRAGASRRRRAGPFLRNVPFVDVRGYCTVPLPAAVQAEAYRRAGRTVFPGVAGCEYFMAYNGVLEAGQTLEAVDAQWGCAWRPRVHRSAAARAATAAWTARLGRYVVVYVVAGGMYGPWWEAMPVAAWVAAVTAVAREQGAQVLLVGAPWDVGGPAAQLAAACPAWHNAVGQTTFDQLLGILDGAVACVGMPAGVSLIAPALGCPTVVLWHAARFVPAFWAAAAAPVPWYAAVDAAVLPAAVLPGAVAAVVAADARGGPRG